jgi:hypothetical protein
MSFWEDLRLAVLVYHEDFLALHLQPCISVPRFWESAPHQCSEIFNKRRTVLKGQHVRGLLKRI